MSPIDVLYMVGILLAAVVAGYIAGMLLRDLRSVIAIVLSFVDDVDDITHFLTGKIHVPYLPYILDFFCFLFTYASFRSPFALLPLLEFVTLFVPQLKVLQYLPLNVLGCVLSMVHKYRGSVRRMFYVGRY